MIVRRAWAKLAWVFDVQRHATCLKLLALVASAYGCALTLLVAPRAVERHLPRAVDAEGQVSCAGAVALAPHWQEVRTHVRVAAEAELAGSVPRDRVDRRVEAAHVAARRAIERDGVQGITHLHEALSCELARVLHGDAPDSERAPVLGAFLDELAREHVIDDGGRLLLPYAVVEALYRVRIDLVLGIDEFRGIDDAALRSYFGALSFHAPSISAERRMYAAQAYRALGAQSAAHALAYALEAVDPAVAAGIYDDIYAQSGELRARNTALALARKTR